MIEPVRRDLGLDELGHAGALDWSRISVDSFSLRATRGDHVGATRSTGPSAGPSCTWPLRARGDLTRRGIKVRIARRGVESSERLGRHRWKAERSIAWLASCRRLRSRYARDWPGLWDAALAMKGWHHWLMIGRLAEASAEIALGLGRPEAAADAARASIAHARRVGRVKYEVASRTVLGAALLQLRRPAEAVIELRRGLAGAERLKHPPSIWRAAAELGAALYAAGDDEHAAVGFETAQATVRSFAATLAPERQRRLLTAQRSTFWHPRIRRGRG